MLRGCTANTTTKETLKQKRAVYPKLTKIASYLHELLENSPASVRNNTWTIFHFNQDSFEDSTNCNTAKLYYKVSNLKSWSFTLNGCLLLVDVSLFEHQQVKQGVGGEGDGLVAALEDGEHGGGVLVTVEDVQVLDGGQLLLVGA